MQSNAMQECTGHAVPAQPAHDGAAPGWRNALGEAAAWAGSAARIGAWAVGGGAVGALAGLICAVALSAALWALGALESDDPKAQVILIIAPFLYVVVGVALGWRIGFARGLARGALRELHHEGKLRSALERLCRNLLDRLAQQAAQAESGPALTLDATVAALHQMAQEQDPSGKTAAGGGRLARGAARRVQRVVMPGFLDVCAQDLQRISHDGRVDAREVARLSLAKLDEAITERLRWYARWNTLSTLIAAAVIVLLPLLLARLV